MGTTQTVDIFVLTILFFIKEKISLSRETEIVFFFLPIQFLPVQEKGILTHLLPVSFSFCE